MRRMRRAPLLKTLLTLSAALLVCAGALLIFWRIDRVSVAEGIVTGGSVAVCAARDGLIQEVLVSPGDAVRAGQPLLRLDTRDLEVETARRAASIEALETRRRAAIEEREHLSRAVHPRERDEAERARERQRLRLEQSQIAAEATAKLGKEGLAGRLDVEKAELDRKLAAVALADAEQAIGLLTERQRAALDALDAEARRLEEEIRAERVQREAALQAIQDSTLHAAGVGVVATRGLEDLRGRAVTAGDEILRLTMNSPGRFEGTLSDAARVPVRPDQQVKIRLEAYPWLVYGTLAGRVLRVGNRRDGASGFPVEIEVDPHRSPGPLTDGMRGTARIILEERISLARLLLEKAAGKAGS